MNMDALPPYEELINPVLAALHELGGSARKAQVVDRAAETYGLSATQLEIRYDGGMPVYQNLFNSVRVCLIEAGLIEGQTRGVWTLTPLGHRTRHADPSEIHRLLETSHADSETPSQPRRRRRSSPSKNEPLLALDEFFAGTASWRDELAGIIHGLSPRQIQQLLLRLFHADGMLHIETLPSGGSADLDGFMSSGGGLLNLRIAFRFLRGGHLTSADDLDDFRSFTAKSGAVNGILFSTAGFTGEAERFASTGTPRIELYDLDRLSDSLMQMSLGIGTEIVRVERVTIDKAFFDSL